MKRDGYSIVGQGKIDEIISSKSEDKRKVFEEASGIAKYRYQKEEAERKLEGTVENLIRLEDIENELKSRIGPLERDSEKAKKYLEIFEQKKSIDVSLAVYDLDNAKSEKEKLEENIAGLKAELDVADSDLQDVDREYEEVTNTSSKNRIELERVSNELSDSIEKASKSLSSAELSKNDNIHLTEKLDEIKSRLESETKLMEEEGELAYEKGNLLASSEQKIATLKQECEKLQSDSDELETELEKIEKALKESIEDSERIHSADVDEKIRLSAVVQTTEFLLGNLITQLVVSSYQFILYLKIRIIWSSTVSLNRDNVFVGHETTSQQINILNMFLRPFAIVLLVLNKVLDTLT